MTTVGYGDIVPDQTGGKIIGCFLMLGGLSLIPVVTAAITSGFGFRADAPRRAAGEDPVVQKLDQLAVLLQRSRRSSIRFGHRPTPTTARDRKPDLRARSE